MDKGAFAGTLITVQQIDPLPNGDVTNRLVHVEAEILLATPEETTWMVAPLVGHMPFTEEAFNATAMQLAAEGAEKTDTFAAGYEIWRQRYDSGMGGIFEVPIDQALEQTFDLELNPVTPEKRPVGIPVRFEPGADDGGTVVATLGEPVS